MKRTTLRIDNNLHQAITLAAKEDRRSLNEQIVVAIQDHLRKRSKRRQRAQKQGAKDFNEK